MLGLNEHEALVLVKFFTFVHSYFITEFAVASDTRLYFQFNSKNDLKINILSCPMEDTK